MLLVKGCIDSGCLTQVVICFKHTCSLFPIQYTKYRRTVWASQNSCLIWVKLVIKRRFGNLEGGCLILVWLYSEPDNSISYTYSWREWGTYWQLKNTAEAGNPPDSPQHTDNNNEITNYLEDSVHTQKRLSVNFCGGWTSTCVVRCYKAIRSLKANTRPCLNGLTSEFYCHVSGIFLVWVLDNCY